MGLDQKRYVLKKPGMDGAKKFITPEDITRLDHAPKMDGQLVFKNAVVRMTKAVKELLQRNDLTVDDIDLLVPHQANARINEMIRAKLGFKEENVVSIIGDYGNTTAATLPMGFYRAIEDGRLKKGKLVVTVAFGAGFSWELI